MTVTPRRLDFEIPLEPPHSPKKPRVTIHDLKYCNYMIRGQLIEKLDNQRRMVQYLCKRGYAIINATEHDRAIELAIGVLESKRSSVLAAKREMINALKKVFRNRPVEMHSIDDLWNSDDDGVLTRWPTEQLHEHLKMEESGKSGKITSDFVMRQNIATNADVATGLTCYYALSEQGPSEQRIALVTPNFSEPVQTFIDRFANEKREHFVASAAVVASTNPSETHLSESDVEFMLRNGKLIHEVLKPGQILIAFNALPMAFVPGPLPKKTEFEISATRRASVSLVFDVQPRFGDDRPWRSTVK